MSKKAFYALLAVCAAAIAAGVFLIISAQKASGAEDPVAAVWGYQRSAMLYDADGMLNYSSEYNTAVLGDHVPKGAELKEYLKRQYSSVSSRYEGKELTRTASVLNEYSAGDAGFDELYAEYIRRAADGEPPSEFAEIRLVIYSNGAKALELTVYAVKTGGKWYYFKTK